jgi:hypothetical protein
LKIKQVWRLTLSDNLKPQIQRLKIPISLSDNEQDHRKRKHVQEDGAEFTEVWNLGAD